MARLFGALANAGAQYNKGRFAREQYDAEQQKIARDEARRAFEFGVTNDRLMQQAKEATELRKAAQERLNQQDQFEAIQAGAEDTPVESLAAASQAFLQGQGMGMPQQAVRAPQTARKVQQAEGIDFSAEQAGAPAYINAGGRVLRYDPQKAANASADKAMRDHLTKIMMEKQRSAGDMAEIDRRAMYRNPPNPPQRRTQLVQGADGEYVIVDLDQLGPTGLKGMPRAGGAAQAADAKMDPMRMALKDVGAQALAKAENGGFRTPGLGSSALYAVEQSGTPIFSKAAGATRAKVVDPQVQVQQQLIKEVESMILPLKGGKAITEGERKIITGVFERTPGEPPEMRQAKVAAFERLIATTAAKAGEDPAAIVAEMRQRASQYKQRPSASERLKQLRTGGDAR